MMNNKKKMESKFKYKSQFAWVEEAGRQDAIISYKREGKKEEVERRSRAKKVWNVDKYQTHLE